MNVSRSEPTHRAAPVSTVGSTFASTFVRWLSRRALRWYYREMLFVGRDRIPATGPVLLVGNHPNDLPDVLAGFFTTPRPVRYVATISATTLPLAAATYRGLGVIPVARVRDARKMRAKGVDVGAVNHAAFEALRDAFRAGEIVGVFPEGGVHDAPYLGAIRTGAAKMALEASDNGALFDVTVVPFGMQYEDALRPRSDVIVAVGEPFSLRGWLADSDDRSAVAFAERLRQALLGVTRNSSTWERAGARDRLVAAVAATCAPPAESLLEFAGRVQHACARLVAGDDLSEAESARRDATVVQWQTITNELGTDVLSAGGHPGSARDTARVLAAAELTAASSVHAAWPNLAVTVLLAPAALAGLVLHAPLWALVQRVARALVVDRTDPPVKAIIPGLHLIFLGYLVLGGGFALGVRAIGWSAWWAVPLTVVLPRAGDLALRWRDALKALRLRSRVRQWPADRQARLRANAARVRDAWRSVAA